MLGNEPALEKYMKEKPRRRDESLVSKKMMTQIVIMGSWLTVLSMLFLKLPFFADIFGGWAQEGGKVLTGTPNVEHLTAYFVLFIVAALFNGFNVRDEGFGIFKGLNLNPGFMKVFFTIILVQAAIVNAALIPLAPFQWIGEMFSCTPFGIKGWIVAVLLAMTMIPVDFIRKAIANHMK